MSRDLPIYSDSPLRSGLQFSDLDRLKSADTGPAWEKADRVIAGMEGAIDVASARSGLDSISKDVLLRLHGVLFSNRDGAGRLRRSELSPTYRGQDCAPPQFIERSLDNFEVWFRAESLNDIHPIERAALAITRILDIWPFEYGNQTVAIVFANTFLKSAGLAPFFVPPEHQKEFAAVIAQSMVIEMQPLVNAIYRTVKREMENLVRG